MRVLPLVLAGCILGAADEATELHLLAGGYPGFREVTYRSDGERRTYQLDDHRGFALQVEAVRRFESGGWAHPWLLGGGVVRFTDATDDGGADHTAVSWSWQLGVGIGARLGRHVILDAGIVGSLGRAGIGDERLDAVTVQDSTWYAAGEVRLGLWAEFHGAMIGLVGGSAVHSAWADYRETHDAESPFVTSSTYDGDGPFILVGIGFRLD